MISLADEYKKACNTPSDINTLIPILHSLGKRSEVIVEMGTRSGVSLRGFLFSRPRKLISYDIARTHVEVQELAKLDSVVDLVLKHGPEWDTAKCEMEENPCLLFIDTKHTGEQVFLELSRHADKVANFLVFHDTTKFGERGCGWTRTNNVPGLMSGINRWRKTRPEWKEIYRTSKCNGLLVLQKDCSIIKWSWPE